MLEIFTDIQHFKLREFHEFAREDRHFMGICGYPVYRMNALENGVVRVGSILEFRRSRRSMNRLGLAKLAQKLFAREPGDIIVVGSDSSLERVQISREYEIALSAG